MRPIDICTTILVTTGNRALRDPSRTRWDEVEELMGISLRPESRQPSRVTMLGEQGERLSFKEWLDGWGAPQTRLWLVPGPWETEQEGASEELPAHLREAFAGGGGLGLLLCTDGRRVEQFMPREVPPRLYEISGAQLYDFMRSRKRAEAWEEALARELGAELDGRSLRSFLESRTPDEMQELISRFMPLSAEVEPVGEGAEHDAEETVKWNQFFTPAPGAGTLSFELLPVGPGNETTVARDVNASRVAIARALKATMEFAQRQGLKYWSKHFRRCLQRLALEPQPLEDVVELLLVNALPTPAIQLVHCAMASDVFGGMGSWNELTFEGAEAKTYQDLSNRLLRVMREAFRTGINSSATLPVP
jgi:hypothetical protein